MKKELGDKLCCPSCSEKLIIIPFDTGPGDSIREGVLTCSNCRRWYPIVNFVPVMLLFSTRLHSEFQKTHEDKLGDLSPFIAPNGTPIPGEESVLETFSEEWALMHLEDEELSFTYSFEDLLQLNRKVWLSWLPEKDGAIEDVLVVGCGGGREAIALSRVCDRSRVVGIDINLALVANGHRLDREENVDAVLCSLHKLPFPKSAFDLVYCQGVLHHNWSTREAFQAISPAAREGGYLFVWVYGLDDHLIRAGFSGLITRLNFIIEQMLRPVISRLPRVLRKLVFMLLGALLHPIVLARVRHKEQWHLANTIHGLRDWLSPRYAHVHSYNEVIEWFEREGFQIISVQLPGAYRNLFGKQLWGVGVTGRRMTSENRSALNEGN